MSEDRFLRAHGRWTARIIVIILGFAAIFLVTAIALWMWKLLLHVWTIPVTLVFVRGARTKLEWPTLHAWIASSYASVRGRLRITR